jgi:DNA segregation ATPase FtsK/SpoIIIE-like protein
MQINQEHYAAAKTAIMKSTIGSCSVQYIQDETSLGYNDTVKVVNALERMGVISGQDRNGQRKILRRV